MATELVTLAEYKAYVGITSPNQDTQIKALIPKVSQVVKSYCRRSFSDYVNDAKLETFNGGTPYLMPSEYPLLAVSSVEYSTDYGKTYIGLTEFTDYVVDTENNTIAPIGGTEFPKSLNAYKVTYTAGYEEVPEEVKLATMDLVTYYLKNDSAVKSQRDAGSNTVQIEYITKNTLPSHIARILDYYVANIN